MFVKDTFLSFGEFFTSTVTITHATMLSIVGAERWLYLIDSVLVLSNVNLSDVVLLADPGLIESMDSEIIWKGGVLRSIWTAGQTLMDAKSTNSTLEELNVSWYNATFLANSHGTVKITNCQFSDGGQHLRGLASRTTVNGGLLSCLNCKHVSVANLTALRLSAALGGALHLVFSSPGSVMVRNSYFINCSAEAGGAVHSLQATLNASENWLEGNRAKNGGGICVVCKPSVLPCRTDVRLSIFRKNAAMAGGAVHWHENRPTFYKNDYVDNIAVYGPNEASAASQLGLIDSNTLQPITQLDYEGIPGQRVPVPLLIGFIDIVGQLVATDNTSYINIKPNSFATFLGSTRLIAVNGIANFSAFIIRGTPGSIIKVEAFSEEIPTFETNYERFPNFSFDYILRECVPGEHAESGTCYTCPKTAYSLRPSQDCTACPSSAICPGGATLDLDSGYWRSSNASNRIETCFAKEACKGGVNATCGEGFESNLCGMCAPGYYRVGKFSCFKCGSEAHLFARIVVLAVFYLALLFVMIYFSLSRIDLARESVAVSCSTLMKIMISFTQTMMLISGIKTEWNYSVLRMFEAMEFFGTIVIGSFAPECYLHHVVSTPIVYVKLIIVSVGVVSFIIFLEITRALIRHYRPSTQRERITAVEVIVVFLLQPVQLKYAMSLLDCKVLDTGSWLTVYMAEQCWEGQHQFYLLTLALPTLIVFGAGFLFLLSLIFFSRHFTQSPITRYFALSLKGNMRHWELVSQSLKLVLAVSIACLGATQTKVQVVIGTIIMYISLYLHIMNQPYEQYRMNCVCIFSIVSVYMYLILAFYTHYFVESAPVLKDVLSFLSFVVLFLFAAVWLVAFWCTCQDRQKISVLPQEISIQSLSVPNNSAVEGNSLPIV